MGVVQAKCSSLHIGSHAEGIAKPLYQPAIDVIDKLPGIRGQCTSRAGTALTPAADERSGAWASRDDSSR